MHPQTRNKLKIDIKNELFVDESVCFYQFYVDLDFFDTEKNDYLWVLTYENLTSVQAVIGAGKDLITTSEANDVTAPKLNFNVQKSLMIFVSFTGDKARKKDDDPAFTILMELITNPKIETVDEQDKIEVAD